MYGGGVQLEKIAERGPFLIFEFFENLRVYPLMKLS